MNDTNRVGILHVHSAHSHDGRDSLADLHEFARSRGISVVGLTDHAEDLSAEEWPAYVSQCREQSDVRVQLLPGLEFRFAGFPGLHLLAIGLDRWIAPETPAAFVRDCAPTTAFTIVAHPVLADYHVPPEVRAGICAIEVWNASYNTRYLPDPRAIRLLHDIQSRRPEVVGIAGLDQHDRRNDRETRVRISPDGSVIDALRSGRFDNEGRTMRFGSDVPIRGARLACLSAARWAFDQLERTQDAIARRLRRT
ncbi:MAG TPA: PHP domain-containing protein [Gemmatimonadaceae bacterium]|nr:PHP domain-containing protein [Gemmatimonadaceae bacterium]